MRTPSRHPRETAWIEKCARPCHWKIKMAPVIVVCPTYNNTSPREQRGLRSGTAADGTNYHNRQIGDCFRLWRADTVPTRNFRTGVTSRSHRALPGFPWVRSLPGIPFNTAWTIFDIFCRPAVI